MFQSLFGPSFIFRLIAIIVSLTLHEFAHAWTADILGDKTPRIAGRITLNPLAHLEPLGLLMILFAPIGWAKPTPVNANNFRHPRSSMVGVALAGPVSNLILALACIFVIHLQIPRLSSGFMSELLSWLLFINIYLFVFNLIPLPPLDGSRVVDNLLPYRWERYYARLETYGPFILLLLVLIPPLRNGFLFPLLNGTASAMLSLFGIHSLI
ncbi:site-2 protease family protein [Alicyclobacillaceae bacterium I2511]|nr:site-2 protease family protein [Alicyclobacillaceae bacterium I2511]